MPYKPLFLFCLFSGMVISTIDLSGQDKHDSIYHMYRKWDKRVFTLTMKDATELKAPLYKVKEDSLLLIPVVWKDYKTFRELNDKTIVPVSLHDVLRIEHKGSSAALTGTLIGLFAGGFIGYASTQKQSDNLATIVFAPAAGLAAVMVGSTIGALVGLAVGSSIQRKITLYPAKNPEAVKKKIRKEAFYRY
jgi:hypothetical protein